MVIRAGALLWRSGACLGWTARGQSGSRHGRPDVTTLFATPCCRLMWRPNRRMIDNIKKLASLLPDDLGAANLHGLFLAVVIRKRDFPATDRGDVAVTERNGFLRFENNSAVLREALH